MKPGYSLWILPIVVGLLAGVATVGAELGWPKAIPSGFGSHGRADPRDLDMFVEAGFKVARADLQWEEVEKEKGKYDFSRYDALTEAWISRGIRPLYILDYSNKLYESAQSVRTEEGRKAFVAFATAAVKRYAGKNIIWEIWNEPNIFFWSPQPSQEDYCKLVAAVAPEIKKADPTAKVIAPATSEIPFDWLEDCFKRGLLEHVDAVSLHPYRQYQQLGRPDLPPETVIPDYERVRQLIKRYAPKGKEIPIVSTEWGYSCFAKGVTHEGQAQYLVRMFLINLWQEVPVSIWFDWKNWGKDWNISEFNAGVVTDDLDPKPAYFAVRALSQTLNGFEFDRRLDMKEENCYVLSFRKDGQRAYAIWTTGEPREITLPLRAGKGTLISMYGERGELVWANQGTLVSMYGDQAAVSWADEGLKVMATGSPRYVILH